VLKFFSGNSTHKVDAKGRVSLPAEFRKVLESVGSSHVVVLPQMKHPDYPVVLSQTAYEKFVENFEAEDRDPDDIEAMAQVIQTNARQIPFDEVGRMVLSKDLRELIGLTDEVRFVGRGSTFQLWEPSRHVAYEAPLKDRGRELAKAMRLGGLH
jgi:MraZ protein